MSLIDEALKTTEEEKDRNSPGVDPLALIPGRRRRARRGFPTAPLLVILLIAAGGVGAWMLFDGPLQDVFASARPAVSAGAATTLTLLGQAKIATPSVREARPEAETTAPVSTEAELAFAKTLEAVKYYDPPIKAAAARSGQDEPRPPLPQGDREPGSKTGAEGPVAKTVPPIPLPPSEARDPEAAVEKKHPKDRSPVAAAGPQQSAPKLKLSGILRGLDGSTAIINGRFLQVGDKIDGAKVVEIGKYNVTLEFAGREVTVGM
ncbi:MAG TPA: hypothetical protein VMZ50_02005 [Phycisphaerae bacterium]|nr:hypothetical protein [Phycisphaerae bacterium]